MSNSKSFKTSLAKLTELAAFQRLKPDHNLQTRKAEKEEIINFYGNQFPNSTVLTRLIFLKLYIYCNPKNKCLKIHIK